jgi:hypothetical protein
MKRRGRYDWSSHATIRFKASRSDPSGLCLAEAFGNSFEDSVSFRFPSRQSLGVSPLLRHSLIAAWLRFRECHRPCERSG